MLLLIPVFGPFCGRPCKTSIVCTSCWSRWFTSTNPKKLSAFTSSTSTSCTAEQLPKLLLNRWLLVFIHQPFCHVCQAYKRLHYLFWGVLTIHDSRVIHWQPAVLQSQQIDCLAGLCCLFTFNFIGNQVKIESGKTPRGEKSPRYEVSENYFRFDESSIP